MATPFSNQGGVWAVKISSTWTKIPKFTKVTKSGGDLPVLDATGIDDTSAASVPGLPSPASIDFECYWDPANSAHTYLETLRGNQAVAEFRYQLPGLPGPAATAIRFDYTGQVADHNWVVGEANAVGKITGKITLVTGPTKATGAWDA